MVMRQIERAMMIGYRFGFYIDDELLCTSDFVTAIAAKVLGLANYGLRVGASVDLIVPDADHAPTTVVARPVRRAVYKATILSRATVCSSADRTTSNLQTRLNPHLGAI